MHFPFVSRASARFILTFHSIVEPITVEPLSIVGRFKTYSLKALELRLVSSFDQL